MGSFSDYTENAVLDHLFRHVSLTSPAAVYCALYTSNPNETNVGAEVSGGSYARVAITNSAASGGSITNSTQIAFPTASGSWGTITHFAIFDALTTGNMLAYGALGSSQGVTTGQRPVFDASALTITLD